MNAIRKLLDVARGGRVSGDTQQVTLCLWFPAAADLEAAVRPALREGVVVRAFPERRAAWLTFAAARLDDMVAGLADGLGAEGARGVEAMVVAGADGVRRPDPARVATIARLAAARSSRWVEEFVVDRRLTSHFQPIVEASLPTRVFGHEALMRGQAPGGALVPPVELLAAARVGGQLLPLDRGAREAALREAARLGLAGALFVNFSPAAVSESRRYLERTVELTDELGFQRERIAFEITETDRIPDLGAFRRVLGWYRDEGFRIALDDVGSGYSSLRLIDQLRPDFVKIDMDLVRGVHEDPFRAAITAKLLELAQSLGIRTVAEGVEHVAEWRWLREHGADLVQGYLYGRPGSPPPAVGGELAVRISFLEAVTPDAPPAA